MCAEDDIIEHSTGCICCTVADDFVPTMKQLLDRPAPPDHIVIETSGLALPQPLVRAFNWPEIRTRVTVDSVITVVDGPATAAGRFAHDEAAIDAQRAADGSIDHETPLSELFEDQLACADMVVIAKTDLMTRRDIDSVLGGLAGRARAGVQLIRSSADGLSVEVLLGLDGGLVMGEAALSRGRAVDHGDDAVDGNPGADLGPVEGAHQGLRQRQAGGLDDAVVGGRRAVQQLLHGRHEIVGHGAADAAVGKLDDIVLGAHRVAAAAQHLGVDADVAELVDDQGDALAAVARQQVADQGRLAGAEKAGDDGGGNLLGHDIAPNG